MRIHAIFIAIYLLVFNTPNLSADETQNRILYQDIEKDITFVEYQNPTTKSPWFYPPDNVKSVIKKYSKEAHMSAEETEKIMRTAPRFQLLLHMAEYSEMAVYRIGINMPNDTSLRFIPKALKLTILDLYGQIIEIQEFSIIFPIRLSATGQLLPCLQGGMGFFDLLPAIKSRDQKAVGSLLSRITAS